MTDDGLFAFLASQPLLALTIATILCATLGWRLQISAPRAGMVLRNVAYVSMVGVALFDRSGPVDPLRLDRGARTAGGDRSRRSRDDQRHRHEPALAARFMACRGQPAPAGA